jgi:2-isopropylmalate synthase
MPSARYQPFLPLVLHDRTWPSRSISKAPLWCSVDLRDGNQALPEPMDPSRKRRMLALLVAMGFSEIEVGFPAASQPDFEFTRQVIEQHLVPDDVWIQVLTQSRQELIARSFESLRGAKRAIMHFYNSTNPAQREIVFQMTPTEVRNLAVSAAETCLHYEHTLPGTELRYEYSPESFTLTEPEYALEVCEAVCDVLQPTPDRPLILNLPATVECYTPNVYADVVEWFSRNLSRRDSVVLSIHPHNDRGSAVAAAELAVMAGADRVEGTLFGNGERTGNVDITTLAVNLMANGVDPELDLRDIDAVARVATECTGIGLHPRHPWAGQLVYTAFSGSHQDAIKKGFAVQPAHTGSLWRVPYLPIDPKDLGRTYEAVVRVNSQSGKGGVAYVMSAEHGFELPRGLQIEFSKHIQSLAELSGTELTPTAIWDEFETLYLPGSSSLELRSFETCNTVTNRTAITAQVRVGSEQRTLVGEGNGPIDAFIDALTTTFGVRISVKSYTEHSLGEGSDAAAVAYVEIESSGKSAMWGVGRDENTVAAALRAVLQGAEKLCAAR